MASFRKAFGTAVLAAGLALAPNCATLPKKTPVKAAKAEPEDVDIGPIMASRNPSPAKTACGKALPSKRDKTIERVAKEAGLTPEQTKQLCKLNAKIRTVHVGDSVSVLPSEAPKKVTSIDAKEIRFSDGNALDCGSILIQPDTQTHILVSRMNGNDRSVIIVTAVCPSRKGSFSLDNPKK